MVSESWRMRGHEGRRRGRRRRQQAQARKLKVKKTPPRKTAARASAGAQMQARKVIKKKKGNNNKKKPPQAHARRGRRRRRSASAQTKSIKVANFQVQATSGQRSQTQLALSRRPQAQAAPQATSPPHFWTATRRQKVQSSQSTQPSCARAPQPWVRRSLSATGARNKLIPCAPH